ncbi:MAG: hypothetical protein BGO23_03265 [Solirubrobacterales bacterium 67-14]|nr:MAG: hypothetical protein BGO23_03265 [Solirubrobacterales bacterium 67-14]
MRLESTQPGTGEDSKMDDEILTRTFCIEVSHFPDVDEAWLNERATAIGLAINDRLIHKLEWGRVYALTDRNGIGLVYLMWPEYKHDETVAATFMEIICEKTDIVMPKPGSRKKPHRKGGMPQFGLGPRYPAEFFASHGKIDPVSPVIHSGSGEGKRARTQKPGWQGA